MTDDLSKVRENMAKKLKNEKTLVNVYLEIYEYFAKSCEYFMLCDPNKVKEKGRNQRRGRGLKISNQKKVVVL